MTIDYNRTIPLDILHEILTEATWNLNETSVLWVIKDGDGQFLRFL